MVHNKSCFEDQPTNQQTNRPTSLGLYASSRRIKIPQSGI
jgi:hypothetical protein